MRALFQKVFSLCLLIPLSKVFFSFSDDPQDAQVAAQYKNNFKAFERKATEWTKQYAVEINETERVKLF